MKLWPHLWIRAWNLVSLVALPLAAPLHVGFDVRPVLIEWVERSIEFHEGGDTPGSLPWRQNNPCALIWRRQSLSRPGRNGYARFSTRQAGERACRADLTGKFARGLDLGEILDLWNGSLYAPELERETGLSARERFYAQKEGSYAPGR